MTKRWRRRRRRIRQRLGRWSGRHLYSYERRVHGASRWGAALFAALAILQRELGI